MMDYVYNSVGERVIFSAALVLMDDEICTRLNEELAPCDNQTFFDAYCTAHKDVIGDDFTPDIGGAW